jgi:hypothetical protein
LKRGRKLLCRVVVGCSSNEKKEEALNMDVIDCVAKSIDGGKKKQQGDSNAESKAAKRAHVGEEIIRRKDGEVAALREKLMKVKHKKKQYDKTMINDAVVVEKAILAFNRATIVNLTSNLQDALVEKSKLLGLEAQLKISEEKSRGQKSTWRGENSNKEFAESITLLQKA